MSLFDRFGAGQASNGTGPPNPQMTSGAPGYNIGSWGNQPQNFAGGLQDFLASVGVPGIGQLKTGAKPGMGPTQQPGLVTPPAQPGPAMGVGTPTGASPGTFGASSAAAPAPPTAGAPGVVSSVGQRGTPDPVPNGYGASTPGNAAMPAGTNFANTMRPYLGG